MARPPHAVLPVITRGEQLTCEAAAAGSFETVFDLIPDSDVACIVGTDGRCSLSAAELRRFVEAGPVDSFSTLPDEIRPGCRVVLGLPNGPEAAVAFLALSVRCVVAPLNVAVTEDEAEFELTNLPADAVIVQAGSTSGDTLRTVAHKLNLRVIELVADARTVGKFSLQIQRKSEAATGADHCASAVISPSKPQWLARHDVCLLLHTSGTTLRPKLVPLTHENLCTAALCIASTLELQTCDIGLNFMPLHHLHGIMVNLLVSIVSGSAVVCTAGWRDAGNFFQVAQQYGATWYSAVPSMHLAIVLHAEQAVMRTGEAPTTTINFARNCSAALSPSIAARLETALDCQVLTTYAMSECVPICSNPRHGLRKLGSVGPPAGPQVRILIDPAAERFAEGPSQEGEVCVRGTCCTSGYEYRSHMDPNFKAHTRDGWLRTGDKGYFDEDGYLFLTGRFKELINRGGEKLSPLLIEDIVCTFDHISQCTVFAAPHEDLGEAVAVAFVPRPGAVVSLRALRTHMLQTRRIQNKWLPECLVQVDQIPKGPTGKPLRIGLARLFGLPVLTHRANGGAVGSSWRGRRKNDSDKWLIEAVENSELDSSDNGAIVEGPCVKGDAVHAQVRQIALDVLCVSDLSAEAILMDHGLDSMTAVVLVERLCAELDVDLEANVLDACPSVRHLADRIRNLVGHRPELQRGPGLWCEYQREDDLPEEDGDKSSVSLSAGESALTTIADTNPSKSARRSHEAQLGRAERKAERRAKFAAASRGGRKVENASVAGSSLFYAKAGDVDGLRANAQAGAQLPAIADRHGLTALQWAAGGGHVAAVKYLIDEAGCDIDHPNKEGRTPLMWACRNGHLEVAKLLASRGANVHATTKKGVSPLHWATWGGSIDVTAWLLSQGSDLEAMSNAGCNAAVWAAAAGRIAMCKYLLEQGANFHQVNYWGHGVVSKASWHGHTDVLRWLFKNAGVSDQLFIINHVGEIPVDLAQQAGHSQTVTCMLEEMRNNPHVFRPFQGNPEVHEHKQRKLAAAGQLYDEL